MSLFSPLKITFKQFGGHFKFFWWPFWFFLLQNLYLLTKLWKQSGLCFLIWAFFFPKKSLLINPVAILNFYGGHFKFFFCGIFIYSQSCGNKVVFVFLFGPSKVLSRVGWVVGKLENKANLRSFGLDLLGLAKVTKKTTQWEKVWKLKY